MDHLRHLLGEGGEDAADVDALRASVQHVRAGDLGGFAMTKGDAVLNRIGSTLVAGSEDEKALALELAAALSKNFANAEGLLFMLEEAGDSLEKFTSQHVNLDGHRDKPDDAIYRNLLTLLICSSECNFRGAQLLELVDNKMSLAFAALAALFRAPFGHEPMEAMVRNEPMLWESAARLIACGIKTLCDFTVCDTYFQATDSRDLGDIDISVLNREFTQNVAQVSRALLQYPILDLVTVHLEEWFQIVRKASMDSMQGFLRMCGTSPETRLRPLDDTVGRLMMYLEAGVSASLTMISNLLTYTNEYSAQLRKFIANHTIFIQNLVLPYACFLCTVLEAAEVQDAESETLHGCVRQILYIIKVLSFVTFRVKVFRAWFRTRNFTTRLLRSKVLLGSNLRTNVIALLARLNVNIDAADASHDAWPEVQACFREVWDDSTERQKRKLSSQLAAPAEVLYPVNKFCKTYKHLSYMWTFNAVAISADSPTPSPTGESGWNDDGYDSSEDGETEKTPRRKFRFDENTDGPTFTLQPYSSRGVGGRGRGAGRHRGRGRGRGRGGRMQFSHQRHRAARQHHVRQLLEKRWASLKGQKNGRSAAVKGVKGFVFDGASGATTIEAPPKSYGNDSFGSASSIEKMGNESGGGSARCPFGDTDSDTDEEPPAPARSDSPVSSSAAPAPPPPPAAILEVSTDKIRTNLMAASRPNASPPAMPFPIRDLAPAMSLGGGGAPADTVNLFKPTRLAPLGGGALPKGVQMNTMFGDEKKGTLGSSAMEKEEPSNVTRIIWEPGTEVARAAVRGEDEDAGEEASPSGIPPSFLCALTHQLVRNPVISPHGDVFERNAILRWFKENGNTCPVTQKPLEVTDLVLDHDLKRDIDEYRLKAHMQAVAE